MVIVLIMVNILQKGLHYIFCTKLAFLGIVAFAIVGLSYLPVSTATVTAFIITTTLYILISILPNGVYSAPELGAMAAPSTGEILQRKIGVAGMYIMNIGLIISLLSSWLGSDTKWSIDLFFMNH